uniref:Ig-like domain-containing protein n=1 Tax=Zonotrichia albicollis TaxID=44394 RepID=A0A8D2MD65_ZONAL
HLLVSCSFSVLIYPLHIYACVAGLAGGDPTKQFLSEVLAKVGQQVVLPCQSNTKESDTNLDVFWYRQFPGDTLKYLLQAHKTSGEDKFRRGRFSMVVYKNNTAPLEIAGVSVQDTAIYYCTLRLHLELRQISVPSGGTLLRTEKMHGSPP